MLAALVATVVATLAALAGVYVVFVLPWRRVVGERSMITTTNGRTIEGTIVARRGQLLTMGNARTFAPDGTPLSVDGWLTIERRHVEIIQTGHAQREL